jgi:CheY-like chemotaxis protein
LRAKPGPGDAGEHAPLNALCCYDFRVERSFGRDYTFAVPSRCSILLPPPVVYMPPPSILLVDPDRDSRAVYGAILRHLGARVLEADSAACALAIAFREPITAAISELLYLADGNCLPGALRDDIRTERIPVYIVTSEIRPDRLQDASDAGAVAIRLKPFGPCELARLVLGL